MPVSGTAPNQIGDAIGKLDSPTQLFRDYTKTSQSMNMGLIIPRSQPSVFPELDDGVGLGPGKGELEKLRDPAQIGCEVAPPLRIDRVEEFWGANRDRIDGTKAHFEIEASLPLR